MIAIIPMITMTIIIIITVVTWSSLPLSSLLWTCGLIITTIIIITISVHHHNHHHHLILPLHSAISSSLPLPPARPGARSTFKHCHHFGHGGHYHAIDCENEDCLVILIFQSNLSQKVEVLDWLVRRVSSWLEDSWSSKSSSPSSGSLVLDPGSHPHFHFLILEMGFSIFSRLLYWVLLLSLDLNTLVSIDHPSQDWLLSLSTFST